MNQTIKSPQLNLVQLVALGVGVVGLVLAAAGAAINLEQFYQSYLFGYMFVLAFALGSLAFMMIHHLSGGAWGLAIRRMLESATLTMPFMALLFIPIGLTVFGDLATQHYLYEWADPAVVAQDPILQAKQVYLNPNFFIIRAIIYFTIWISWSLLICKWSSDQDRTGDLGAARWMRRFSGPGLVLYVLTMTFAVTDWIMSLSPTWFSSIFGVIFMVGQGLSTLALMVILLALLAHREPLASFVQTKHIHDIGKLLFGFVILWAYVSFAQYVIQWSGDLAEETPWYLVRSSGGWQVIVWALMLFHFFVPFFILLSRRLKRNVQSLMIVALFLIVMRLVDLFWIIVPEFETGFSWLYLVMPLGMGGLWLALFLGILKRRPILPVNDPNFEEAFLHHGH